MKQTPKRKAQAPQAGANEQSVSYFSLSGAIDASIRTESTCFQYNEKNTIHTKKSRRRHSVLGSNYCFVNHTSNFC
jgi:hypothetical protein